MVRRAVFLSHHCEQPQHLQNAPTLFLCTFREDFHDLIRRIGWISACRRIAQQECGRRQGQRSAERQHRVNGHAAVGFIDGRRFDVIRVVTVDFIDAIWSRSPAALRPVADTGTAMWAPALSLTFARPTLILRDYQPIGEHHLMRNHPAS